MPGIIITNLPLHADLITLLSYLQTAWGASAAFEVTSLEQSSDNDSEVMEARVELKHAGGTTAGQQFFETLAQRVRQVQSTRFDGSRKLQARAFYASDAATISGTSNASAAGGGGGGSAPQQPKKKKKKNKAKKKATAQDETGNDADSGKPESTTKRKKKKNRSKAHREITKLAQDFHQHLLDHPDLLEQASERDGTHTVFEAFLKTSESSSNHRRTEALVMTKLRQQRLVKSKRVGDNVVMLFADDNGDFPEPKEQIKKLTERSKQSQQNKHNVRVGNATVVAQQADRDDNEPEQPHSPADSSKPVVVSARGKAELLDMKIECSKTNGGEDNPSDDSAHSNSVQKSIQFDAVRIQGPCARHFALTEPTTKQLPMQFNNDVDAAVHIRLSVTVPASRIGLLRASVHCEFTKTISSSNKSQRQRFKIVRWVKAKAPTAVNEAVGQVLQPEAPYERPPRRRYEGKNKPEEIFDPPADKKQGEVNPFRFLPQYGAPPEVTNMLAAGEFEIAIEKWPPVQSDDGDANENLVQGKYGKFWKDMLWASEFQEKQDIMLFDMENTQLKREGRFFSLYVPGLAEKRPSVLRGDIVQVTWNKKLYKGRVEHVRLLDVLLLFHPSFHNSYNPSMDKVDVRFTLSRMSFRLAHDACEKAETNMGRIMLLPSKSKMETLPPRKVGNLRWGNRSLNQEQCMAIEKIVKGEGRRLPYVVFGPPGTGKTTTVVEAIYQLAKHQDQLKILVVAPSNDAADILVERLAPHFPPSELTRILAFTRSVDTLPAPIRRYASGDITNEQQKAEILASRIVVATVNLAARFSHWGIPVGYFDVLVVDEAGHATEPEVITVASTLMDFGRKDNRAGQVVLAGDPQQLGPVITSSLCRKFGLGVSYMERLTQLDTYQRAGDGMFPEALITKLVRNYRSHPAILKLPNEMFYDNDLQNCGDRMVTHSLAKWEHLPNKTGFPILFHSVEGENLREGNSPSWFNPQEAELVLQYVHLLLNDTKPPLQPDEIGIITPYARQAQKIRKALETQGVTSIKVGSVELFQGQERRCIILSTVRSESEHLSSDMRYSLGFVASPKRFNVAITRAKSLLIVVGCARLLAVDKANWRPLLNYCLENNAWCGEEWIPDDSDSDDDDASAKEDDEDDWEVLGTGPSRAMEQEGIATVFHEE